MEKDKSQGFTLVEFMVTLAVSALLIFVAIPGFYGMMQNNKVVSMTNKLSATFNYARTEAIKRSVTVAVCSTADDSFTACGTATDWAKGWIVFIDADGNNDIDAATDLLRVQQPLPEGTSVAADRNLVTYNSTGFVTNNSFTLSLSATGCYGDNARVINITPSGRLSISYTSC
ncbi:prepilin-type N-terminal cleavage/methylation domain-containing protein [Legionella israelensis]|uniref:Type II secretion system protein H n=1 Tax=Legionella israelensis TaxID=454 RepID=A0A0W0VL92_9GAMM|nr:GspH/FimT family pseudopilin [Legionella israelensis]KTD20858.1 type IV pre-pilin [Legionella israelensis]QBR84230.1 prepilin-type N-terminal cleavage/methylation domain-containing protein [Legionella israelensis]QBS08491.1 prepilin-type N-terminal cleavage/methylation domain-containing protein [Legionella israelensis]SCY27018.1 type IV fimbrial biogenesis protein FimT [Legionella israelensis DSM 19235]STX58140.1 type IV pre-pilin [Legionella israelensis]